MTRSDTDEKKPGEMTRILRNKNPSQAEMNDFCMLVEDHMRNFAHCKLLGLPLVRQGRGITTSDVLQELYVRMHEKWHDFGDANSRKEFLAYANKAVTSFLRDELRKMKAWDRMKGIGPSLDGSNDVGDEEYRAVEARVDFYIDAKTKLSESDPLLTQIISAVFELQFETEEVAATFGLSQKELAEKIDEAAEWLACQHKKFG